jgi:nucleoside-diphosphate-sugar epimerase
VTGRRILVTGSDGFMGRSVVRSLQAAGHAVIPVSRRSSVESDVIRCDLASEEDSRSMLFQVGPEVIVNLAAEVDLSARPKTDMLAVNALFPILAADYARRTGAHLVQASTIAVHGSGRRIVGEDTAIDPDTHYGMSKVIADEGIRASGCRAAIVRFAGVFGLNGPPHLLLNGQLMEALAGRTPTVTGEGTALRNYIYVEDAARAVATSVSGQLEGVMYASGETLSFLDMLGTASQEWLGGSPIHHRPGPDAPDRLVDQSSALPSPRSFVEALRDMRFRDQAKGPSRC